MKILPKLIIIVFINCSIYAPICNANPPGHTSDWAIIPELTDEFNGDSLDSRKWHDINPDFLGQAPALFSKANVSINGGNLVLTAKAENVPNAPPRYHSFTTAAIQSKKKILYGYFEIRSRPMKTTLTSSFFFYDKQPDFWTELDVFEIVGGLKDRKDKDTMTAHVFYTPKNKNHVYQTSTWHAPFNFADDFHVFGLLWDKDKINWFVDGQLLKSIKNDYWHQPLTMNIDAETQPGLYPLPPASDLPLSYIIDYVRAWRHVGYDAIP